MLLHGPNGAGKTNLLEALHVGTQGFSPRARRDAQMIRFGADAGRIALAGTRGDGAFETDVVLTRRESRRVALNGDRLVSVERLRHELTTLVFTPDRLAVVKGAPATRRAYLDRAVGRLFPGTGERCRPTTRPPSGSATQHSAGFARVSRHARRSFRGQHVRRTLGAELVALRIDVVGLLAEAFTEAAGVLGLESASLAYEGEPATVAELDARLDADLERGLTGAGPHLHDLRIEAGGRDLRVFGSQGEQRVAVLSLVMSEAAALRERRGTSPLVLLDDVLSELDGDRRAALAAMISRGAQTVVTATAAAALPGEPAQSLSVTPGLVR